MSNPEAERSRHRRSKDGCLPCRARRKKCDQRKPTCVGCERNCLICHWTKEDRSSSFHDPNSPTQQLPSRKGSSAGISSALIRRASYTPTTPHATLITIQPVASGYVLRDPISNMLFNHYLDQTGYHVSAYRGKQNAFVTELPKLALLYPDTILQGVLALSGFHHCNTTRDVSVEVSALSHLACALQSLKHGLTKYVSGSSDDALPLLLTTLILCFIEGCRGDVQGELTHHLRAARPLLVSVLSNPVLQQEETTMEFLKEFYAYICHVTDLTGESCDPYPEEVTLPLTEPLISHKSPGVLLGCAHELFTIAPQICALARRRQKSRRAIDKTALYEESAELSEAEATSLQLRVLSWQPPPRSDIDFATCGMIYQQALLIYLEALRLSSPLFTLASNATIVPQMIQECLDRAIFLIERLPDDAICASTLCWPLALLGCVAREVEHKGTIRRRLEHMWEFLRIGNIRRTLDFLNRLWESQDNGENRNFEGSVGLDEILKEFGVHITFA